MCKPMNRSRPKPCRHKMAMNLLNFRRACGGHLVVHRRFHKEVILIRRRQTLLNHARLEGDQGAREGRKVREFTDILADEVDSLWAGTICDTAPKATSSSMSNSAKNVKNNATGSKARTKSPESAGMTGRQERQLTTLIVTTMMSSDFFTPPAGKICHLQSLLFL